MFESDDFDQVLSQFDFPGISTVTQPSSIEDNIKTFDVVNVYETKTSNNSDESQETKFPNRTICDLKLPASLSEEDETNNTCDNVNTKVPFISKPGNVSNNMNTVTNLISPKHTKRKLIDSHFDPKVKRKFPGPAGLLTGNLEEATDTISHMELLSQDVDFSQNNLRRDLFESPLWMRLREDVKRWQLQDADTIQVIKQQALAGNLRRRKAQTVIAFVETVDRSAIDPLMTIRDMTGSIKCTLHRDAWSTFSQYIVSEYCALVLLKPTVLTTGSAFKKHYLNITLSNIYAIYSSAVFSEDDENIHLPDGYVKITESDFTKIKSEICPDNFGTNLPSSELISNKSDFLEGLDISVFSDDLF